MFADVKPDMRIAQEEIFGPVTAVIRCDSLEDAIEIGNGVKYGLSSSIYTRDVNKAFMAMRDMYTGIFYVNAPTIGAEVHLPFGGVEGNRQRTPRGRRRGHRRVHGVEVDLRRLLGQPAARADRHGVNELAGRRCAVRSPSLLDALSAFAQIHRSRMRSALIDHVLANSQAYETLSYLTDNIGPRLSGSKGAELAVQWTTEQRSASGASTSATRR